VQTPSQINLNQKNK